MCFENHEAFSYLLFFRNRICNIIRKDDKIYHKLFGHIFDNYRLIRYPHNENMSVHDIRKFYFSKLSVFFKEEELNEIFHCLKKFEYGRANPDSGVLISYGLNIANELQRKNSESDLFFVMKCLTFFHYSFARMYRKYSNSLKDQNFFFCMMVVFKTVFSSSKLFIFLLQFYRNDDCCKSGNSNYKLNFFLKWYYRSQYCRSSTYLFDR